VVTKKGQGYKLAEADPVAYHGPGKFDPAVGLVKSTAAPKQTFTQVFGQWLCDMAAQDDRLVGITPAMREGSGMVEFHKRFPDRYYDVGIAEQHAVTFAAGMACEGVKPVVAIYSTFLQRGYDQMIHDVALQNLPVVFALDRAGLVGADGATHAGAYDIPFVRCIPNMSMACPADERECRQLLSTAFCARPSRCRALPARQWRGRGAPARAGGLPFGKGEIRRTRKGAWSAAPRIAILAFGTLLYPALQAAEARCHRGQHALGQAARPHCCCSGSAPRCTRDAGRGRHHGRRGQRRDGSLAAARCGAGACSWACPMCSSSTATRPSCWPAGLDAEGIRLAIAARFGCCPAL
jgi:1-deoxy-D-xylulose-5-phosphate synthase